MADALDILVVEDDPDLRDLLRLELGRLGRVRTAPDAYQAMALVAAEAPDVMILDLLLPGVTGAELLERLDRHDMAVPTVVVSGMAGGDIVERAQRFAPRAVMHKPFDLRLLVFNVIDAARPAVPTRSTAAPALSGARI